MEEIIINGQRIWIFAYGNVANGLQFKLRSSGNFTVLSSNIMAIAPCGNQLVSQIQLILGTGNSSFELGRHCAGYFLDNMSCEILSNGNPKILQHLTVTTPTTNNTLNYNKAKCKGGNTPTALEQFISAYYQGNLNEDALENEPEIFAKLNSFKLK